jgi:hypothetical protein
MFSREQNSQINHACYAVRDHDMHAYITSQALSSSKVHSASVHAFSQIINHSARLTNPGDEPSLALPWQALASLLRLSLKASENPICSCLGSMLACSKV